MEETTFREAILAEYIIKVQDWPKEKLLQELLDLKQVDQVVSYLNAMQERTRTKIIDEFIKSDPKMATDLLERIRTRGMLARGPETAPR